jgi:enoyl-CoA hydratase/carnithine racemase
VEEALALAERIAKLPPQSVRETKRLLNHALQGAVKHLLDPAIATETQSFDEPAFQANLARMLNR